MPDTNVPDHAPPGVQCPCAACYAARSITSAHDLAISEAFGRGIADGVKTTHAALAAEFSLESLALDGRSLRQLIDECAKLIVLGSAATPVLEHFASKVKEYGYRLGHNDRNNAVLRRLRGK